MRFIKKQHEMFYFFITFHILYAMIKISACSSLEKSDDDAKNKKYNRTEPVQETMQGRNAFTSVCREYDNTPLVQI